MKYLLSSVAVVALLAGGPALAAGDKAKQQDKMQQTQMQDKQQPRQAANMEFVQAQKQSDWRASELIGQAVQNPQGDTLGDINDVILDEQGNISAVVIGIGGFLGIGEKSVGVKFSSLQFRTEAPAATKDQTRAPTAADRTPAAQPPQARPAPDTTAQRDTSRERQLTPAERTVEEHDNLVIVLNTTKEQLEAAPAFRFVEDQANKQNRQQQKQRQDQPPQQPRQQ